MKQLRDLTIQEFEKLKELLQEENQEQIDYFSILEVMGEDYRSMSVETFQKIWTEIQSGNYRNLKRGVRRYYWVNGKRYKLTLNPLSLKAGQFLDLQYILQTGNKIEELLSVVLIPSPLWWKRYHYNEGYDIMEVRKELREHMRIGDAMEISDFFLMVGTKLLKVTLDYSKKKLWRMEKKQKIYPGVIPST